MSKSLVRQCLQALILLLPLFCEDVRLYFDNFLNHLTLA